MFKLLLEDVKDRFTGNKAKANARLGLVSAPEGKGKLIWLVADDTYDSVEMAAALLAAISEKRRDVRLVLTYQTEYKDILVRHFNGIKKAGFGYGVGDSKFAVKKMLNNLTPFSIIFVGHQPQKSFLDVLDQFPDIHKIAFQFTPDENIRADFFEACYPNSFCHDKDKAIKTSSSSYISSSFSVLTRLVQSQVDKQLGGMLCGEDIKSIFHMHNLPEDKLNKLIADWKTNNLSQHSLLALSSSGNNDNYRENAVRAVTTGGFNPVLLSQWKQNSLSPNDIIIVDEQKWYAAIATASVATHLFSTDQVHFWQTVSSGAAISYKKGSLLIPPIFADTLISTDSITQVFQYWAELVNDPMKQRKTSDAIRKIFWSERREAEVQVDELLQRVYDW